MANTAQVIGGDLVLSLDSDGETREVAATHLIYGGQVTGIIIPTLYAFVGGKWSQVDVLAGGLTYPKEYRTQKDRRYKIIVAGTAGGTASVLLSPDQPLSE